MRLPPRPGEVAISLHQSAVGPRTPEQRQARAEAAAKEFESVLMKQLIAVMRRTAPGGTLGGSDGSASQIMDMFDEAMADQMVSGQGLGMRQMLVQSLGGEADSGAGAIGAIHSQQSFMRAFGSMNTSSSPTLPPVQSVGVRTVPTDTTAMGDVRFGSIAQSASFLSRPEVADRWSRDGALTKGELSSTLATESIHGGTAAFNVNDAKGFQGFYKCNLFALEAARRAGFAVPVQAREHGWGYPDPNQIVRDLTTDGSLRGNWATPATSSTPDQVNAQTANGGGFLLVGSGTDGRAGHMGVVERIHQIDRAADGSIRRVIFDGWEARENGAQHLVRRTWNANGNAGGTNARNGFTRMEILQLRAPETGTRPETLMSNLAGRSFEDDPASRKPR